VHLIVHLMMDDDVILVDDMQDVLDRVLREADQEDAVALNEDLVEVEVAMLRCMVCPDTFTSEFWLLNHLRTHRPFPKCVHCPRTFWHNDGLELHEDLHRRKANWARRRMLALCLYANPSSSVNLLWTVFGNMDIVRTHVMPFL